MGLNIPGYTLLCISGIDRHKACILSRNMNILIPPGFYCGELVAVLINYNKGKAEKCLVVCSAYLTCDSKNPPPARYLEKLACYSEEENLCLVTGCNSNAHRMVWESISCNDREVEVKKFLNSSNVEILNQGNHSTYCRARRLEVIDITLGSIGLLGRFTSWEVSSEPSSSVHRHILFMLESSVPVSLTRNPRGSY
jgi:hypothetical protein